MCGHVRQLLFSIDFCDYVLHLWLAQTALAHSEGSITFWSFENIRIRSCPSAGAMALSMWVSSWHLSLSCCLEYLSVREVAVQTLTRIRG